MCELLNCSLIPPSPRRLHVYFLGYFLLCRLSDHLARKLFEDLACGVEFLWNNNLVHRDIKPPNLLLSEVLPSDWLRTNMQRSPAAPAPSSCILKIADFGLSRHLHAKNLAETYCGSPLYMAPEILQGLRCASIHSYFLKGTMPFCSLNVPTRKNESPPKTDMTVKQIYGALV